VLLRLVVGGRGFHRSWYHCTQEIFSLLRALTNEAERTLDQPKHGATRACPWFFNKTKPHTDKIGTQRVAYDGMERWGREFRVCHDGQKVK